MANEEHLRILNSGVTEWNRFVAELRARNLRPDLRDARLAGANLNGADLRGAVLVGAVLQKAILYRADLQGANLQKADLRGAHLLAADLEGADLEGAILMQADIRTLRWQPGTAGDPLVTDLSTTRNLRQPQLDQMLGDSLTLIPADLERPEHWPVFEADDAQETDPNAPDMADNREGETTGAADQASAQRTSVLDRLRAASTVDFQPGADGKMQDGAKPMGAAPDLIDPAQLADRRAAQFANIRILKDRLAKQTGPDSNFFLAELLSEQLDQYAEALGEERPNWYALDDRVTDLSGSIADDDKMAPCPSDIRTGLATLIARHHEMRPLVRPAPLPADHPDAVKPAPPMNDQAIDYDEAEAMARETGAAFRSEEARAVNQDSVRIVIEGPACQVARLANELKHGDALAPAERRAKIGLFRRAFAKMGEYMAAYHVQLSSAVTAGVLLTPNAAQTLQTRLQPILDFILKHFS